MKKTVVIAAIIVGVIVIGIASFALFNARSALQTNSPQPLPTSAVQQNTTNKTKHFQIGLSEGIGVREAP